MYFAEQQYDMPILNAMLIVRHRILLHSIGNSSPELGKETTIFVFGNWSNCLTHDVHRKMSVISNDASTDFDQDEKCQLLMETVQNSLRGDILLVFCIRKMVY